MQLYDQSEEMEKPRYERDRDVRFLVHGGKLQILVSLRAVGSLEWKINFSTHTGIVIGGA